MSRRFSLKMRLGWKNAGEVYNLIDTINNLRLEYITLHAKIGMQQCKGTPDYESFSRFYQACGHPAFYNGDLKPEEELYRIFEKHDRLRGILSGRKLLSSQWMDADFEY